MSRDSVPPLSVVVAVRNGGAPLARCLDSVIGQECGGIDLIIIDGASTDGSVGVIEARSDHIGFWSSEPDDGVYSAWNKAVAHVRGDWVCFLGADDRFADPRAVSRVLPALANCDERVVYGKTRVEDEVGNLVQTLGEPWATTRAALPHRMSLPNPSTFYSRELFVLRGRFDETFKIAGDYEFLLRELLEAAAYFVDTDVAVMGAGGLSTEPRYRPRSLREAAHARRLNGLRVTPDWRSLEIVEGYGYAWAHRLLGPGRAERLWQQYQARTARLFR